MRIGLLSDTHGNRGRTQQAIERLLAARVGAVLHAGDVGDAAILEDLGSTFGIERVPVHAVAGNVDEWHDAVARFPADLGVRMHGASAELELGGRRFFLTHGHLPALDDAIASGRFDYVVHGHTHQRRDEHVGATRVINPGAVHRSAEPSIAVLCTDSDRLVVLPLA